MCFCKFTRRIGPEWIRCWRSCSCRVVAYFRYRWFERLFSEVYNTRQRPGLRGDRALRSQTKSNLCDMNLIYFNVYSGLERILYTCKTEELRYKTSTLCTECAQSIYLLNVCFLGATHKNEMELFTWLYIF